MLQLQAATLVLATIALGLTAGFLFAFAHTVMPGLGRAGDRTFVGGFQAVDRAVSNPWFGVSFLGALVLPAVGALLHLGSGERSVLAWASVALALQVATLVSTVVVNLPLNREIQAAGDPDLIRDLVSVRARFEKRWVRWNAIRTGTSVAAFGCMAWALVLHGRLAG